MAGRGWRQAPRIDNGARWEPAAVHAAVPERIAKAVPAQKLYGT
jgi:hypothetical protein